MKLILLSLLLLFPLQDDFTVEPLKPEEAEQLKKAEKELAEAQGHLDILKQQIKVAHGWDFRARQNLTCTGTVTEVELRGGYALITKKVESYCGW